jgi:hypothetical protein
VGKMIVRHTFFMAQTLHIGKITCLIIFGPKFWWIIISGLTHVLDHRNLTKSQRVLLELDAHACCYLMNALSFDLMKRINYVGTAREI